MKCKLETTKWRKVTRANIYKQYTTAMTAFDMLLDYMEIMPVDDIWKRKHLAKVLIEWLQGRDTEGYKGIDSVVYNTLWEIMEQHERDAEQQQ